MANLALTFYSVLRMPIVDILECAKAAENAGFGYISVAESYYRDGAALSAAISANTGTIKLGTSVFPIYTRTPFQLAMSQATLHELSGGRIGYLGLGVGYRYRTENYFGLSIKSPVERMAEYVKIIRLLLSGEDVSYSGELFQFKNFPRLVNQQLVIPIYFGSSGRRMLRLAGEIGDGVILNSLATPDHINHAREMIREGAEIAGRDPAATTVASSVIYSVSDNLDDAAQAAKEDILFYLGYPEITPILDQSGFREEAEAIRTASIQGNKEDALGLISQRMLDSFAIWGRPSECRAKLQELIDAGLDLPIIRVSNVPFAEADKKRVFLRAIESLRDF